MNVQSEEAITILERTPRVLSMLLQNIAAPWSHSNEGENTWSPFDIIGHLVHGEKTDWIPRMKIILSDVTDKRFEPFDRFAQIRESTGKNLNQLLMEFEFLRMENIRFLKQQQLNEDALNRMGIHPEFGPVSLRQLLSTWVVHDLDHCAQIFRVMAQQYKHETGPWQAYLPVLKI